MQVSRWLILALALLTFAGCAQTQPAVLGTRPSDSTPTRIASLKKTSAPQTIQGTMIDKCPVAGCWFHVKDGSGVIKVDTKNAGFVVTNVPLNSHVTVTGIVHGGDDDFLAATGMSYR
jgi:uncharacterized protein YdeI (BOF family)